MVGLSTAGATAEIILLNSFPLWNSFRNSPVPKQAWFQIGLELTMISLVKELSQFQRFGLEEFTGCTRTRMGIDSEL
jgi:hypothetical protein